MRKPGYCLCCAGEDGAEDLFWFSHEAQVTEAVAREKFRQHAVQLPPEVGLRLDATASLGEDGWFLEEKLPLRAPAVDAGEFR